MSNPKRRRGLLSDNGLNETTSALQNAEVGRMGRPTARRDSTSGTKEAKEASGRLDVAVLSSILTLIVPKKVSFGLSGG